ncbi:MAG TPA: SGNH/GDSL hydrolase family protein [Candidatus Binatia bacterium]|jgi:hypothetical protein|nr:SGNH/GDSL hydrolase family protein [Candidatus Binatia bacterium]
MKLMRLGMVLVLGLLAVNLVLAQSLEPKPTDACFERFQPVKAPGPAGLVLKRGDRVAICGDSITEQKMYSRLIEDYLTMCVPELNVSVRQYGWNGEKAVGFLARMTNDCLRFRPTVATTCYGMNDHEYRPYEGRIGRAYRESSIAVVEAFKAKGTRVIEGSPGCVGKVPGWVKNANGTVEDLNLSLCELRNIGIEIAEKEKAGFADVFWPMLTAGVLAQREYGTNYAIAGRDGVHPGWAGHTVMAYAFLKAFGLSGDIGKFTVDIAKNRMKVSKGHKVVSAKAGEFQIRSTRYPFCACVTGNQVATHYPVCEQDDLARDSSIRSGMSLVPFNPELNRLELVVENLDPGSYKVTWGSQSKSFTAGELGSGVNLAEEFPCNPFCVAFGKVDAAVAAKEAYETKQIKTSFHSAEAKTNMMAIIKRTEKEREPLAAAIRTAFVPVTHTLSIQKAE